MHQEPKAKKLVTGIVRLSKALGFSIVAEGIESEADITTLKAMSVEYGQGFYISKPKTIAEIQQQIRDGA